MTDPPALLADARARRAADVLAPCATFVAFNFVAWNLGWAAPMGVVGYVLAAVLLAVPAVGAPWLHGRLVGRRFRPGGDPCPGERRAVRVVLAVLAGAAAGVAGDAMTHAETRLGTASLFGWLTSVRASLAIPGAAPP